MKKDTLIWPGFVVGVCDKAKSYRICPVSKKATN